MHQESVIRTGVIVEESFPEDLYEFRYWRVFSCTSCAGCVLLEKSQGSIEMYPQIRTIDPSIPPDAARYLREALLALKAPSACIMVACSAIDQMLKERGYADGKLYPRINQAVKDHLLTQEMGDWAHDVRLDANGQRHADRDRQPPGELDAKRCVDFAFALAEYLFVLPSKVKRAISKPESGVDQSAE